jgi:hypothetical protein
MLVIQKATDGRTSVRYMSDYNYTKLYKFLEKLSDNDAAAGRDNDGPTIAELASSFH